MRRIDDCNHRVLAWTLLLGFAAAAGGCGDDEGLVRKKGRVVKGGQNFIPAEGEHLQIEFVPIVQGGGPPPMQYWAGIDQATGTFWPDGPMKKGMPPGKYRVSVELIRKKKDVFEGKFDAEISPFVFDIDEETEEIVIDLDNPPPYDVVRQPRVNDDEQTGG
jgi:hypothetical protein